MRFSFADPVSVSELCTLFNTAFSDYVLPMVLTQPVLDLKLTRDGTQLSLSPVALQEENPVGFILNSLGEWKGKKTAYNGGTGVVPSARGQSLTEQMYSFCLPMLQEEGVEQCLLEVIQINERALSVYQKLGFDITRTLRCFRHPKEDWQWHSFVPQEVEFKEGEKPSWPLYKSFWDMEPSWQHHTAAIDRSLPNVQVLEAQVQGACVGYSIIFPLTGAIAQIAVSPAWREKGIGQGLLQRSISAVKAPTVSVLNVEEKGESLLHFLQHRSVQEIPGQFEMVWVI